MEDARSLQRGLGYQDRQKLDEYMTSVREIEKRLDSGGTTARRPSSLQMPPGIPEGYEEHIRLMFDLQVLAFQADSTRVSTFLLAHDGSTRAFPEIGVPDAHHAISHHGNDPAKLEKIARIDEFYSRQFAWFLKRLRDTKEGEGSLLDRCMIVYGGGISDPDSHSHDDLPVILAGGGGGTLRNGRHLRLQGGAPMCNLHLSLLRRMGVNDERFGDSTGTLESIA